MTKTPDPKPNAEFRAHLIWGTAVGLFLLFLCGMIPRFIQDRKLDREAAKIDPVQVTVQVAKPNEEPTTLTLPSSTQADHITPIWARANGYLVQLLADIGDVVKEGQVLAVLDTPEVDEQYRTALWNYEMACATRDIAKISDDRWQEIYRENPDAISKQEVDERHATFLEQEAAVLAAKATMKQYEDLMEFKNIVAPFDGIIIQRDIDLGSLISAGSNGNPQQLFVIAKTNVIRVYVEVPQNFVRSIQEGVEGLVEIREFPKRVFKGVVTRYAKALDFDARTMRVQLNIDNSDGALLAGLFANVTFIFKPEQPTFTVPTPAVIIRSGDPQIALVDENDLAELRNVEIGLDTGTTFQIVDGIKTNDRIITNPNEKVKTGVKVAITS